jgi:hypothetical protein
MSQHIFSKTEVIWLAEKLDTESENWQKEILPILKKEAEIWERVLSAFWEIDTGKPAEARAREVVKRTISHLKNHITEFETDGEQKL